MYNGSTSCYTALKMFRFRDIMRHSVLSTALLSLGALSWAQDPAEVPNPPSIPTKEERARAEQSAKHNTSQDDDRSVGVQTKETVVGSSTVTEFSRGGQVFMLRVKPKNAPAQYIDESLPGGQLTPDDPGISENTQTNLPKWRLGSF